MIIFPSTLTHLASYLVKPPDHHIIFIYLYLVIIIFSYFNMYIIFQQTVISCSIMKLKIMIKLPYLIPYYHVTT